MEHMYDVASTVQNQWRDGIMSRFDVVEAFLGELLRDIELETMSVPKNSTTLFHYDDKTESLSTTTRILSNLKIITSVKNGYFGLKPDIRTPSSVPELHEMLLQTTWIPFATGADLWHKDHMDGAFSISNHPKCEHEVGLMLDPDLFANIVNVNLGERKVRKFWDAGFSYGL